MQNENARILQCFYMDFFEADVTRKMFTSNVIKVQNVYASVSNLIYHEYSHGAPSYGKNINVMIEFASSH